MEAQTLCLHTLDSRQHGGLREHSVFYAHNAVLRSGQANALALWSEHSFLFCSVLKKLTCVAATGPAAHTVVSLDLQGQHSLAEFCHFHLCAEKDQAPAAVRNRSVWTAWYFAADHSGACGAGTRTCISRYALNCVAIYFENG